MRIEASAALDGPLPLVRGRVRQERRDLRRVRDDPDRVEREPPEESRVVGLRAGVTPQGAVDDVLRPGLDSRGYRHGQAASQVVTLRPIGVVRGRCTPPTVGIQGGQSGRLPVDKRLPAQLRQRRVTADQPRDVAR